MKTHTAHFNFVQTAPQLKNEFTENIFLQDYLNTYFPAAQLQKIIPDLENLGQRVTHEFLEWAKDAETNEPKLIQFNAWGKRIDEIIVAQGWKNLEKASADEGLIAIGYERKFAEFSRLYQFVKLYLFTPSSAIYTCPLAMTDGAARLIELYGDEYLKTTVLKHLTSRNTDEFKTSGQWMTERTGGSDVSKSMTLATKENDTYILRGHKWFTSAITADMAFTLASTEQATDEKRAPLSLFYLPIRNKDNSLNGIEVEALKDKLGTRALPTAQLLLTGCKARLVGEKGKGVKTISTLFNITRIYNTISAVSYIRRAYALCKAYSTQRVAFGKKIEEHILYKRSLRELEIAYQSNTLLALFLPQILGKEECEKATKEEKELLRVLTPVAKLYTAKQAIQFASEHIEMFGGLGYLEDSGIPVMLRDTQTLSIWEGTTNVLSLDMLRAMEKENGLHAFKKFTQSYLEKISTQNISTQKKILETKIETLFLFINEAQQNNQIEAAARDIAFYIAEVTIAILWLDFINNGNNKATYLNTLDYWLQYKMNEINLRTSTILNL